MPNKPIRVLQVVPSLNRSAGVARVVYNWHQFHDEKRVHFDYLHHSSRNGVLMHDFRYDEELQADGSQVFTVNYAADNFSRFTREMKHTLEKIGGDYDIVLPDGFKAKWNLQDDKVWAINPNSFEEVGCIHTAQGLEFDYVGVLIGKDLKYDQTSGRVVADKNEISKDDKSSGIRSCKDDVLVRKLILNTYKTLLTRGQKGCYVYCEDRALAEYIKKKAGTVKH